MNWRNLQRSEELVIYFQMQPAIRFGSGTTGNGAVAAALTVVSGSQNLALADRRSLPTLWYWSSSQSPGPKIGLNFFSHSSCLPSWPTDCCIDSKNGI